MRALLFTLSIVLAVPSVATAQRSGSVRVLFVPDGTMPAPLRVRVERMIASRARMVSFEAYRAACARRRQRPGSPVALRRIAPRQNADVIVVASFGGHHRRRVLRVRYYNGRTGELVSTANHTLRAMRLRPASQHAILNDLAEAGGRRRRARAERSEERDEPPEPQGAEEAVERPRSEEPPPAEEGADEQEQEEEEGGEEGGLPPPLDWDEPDASEGEEAEPEEASDEEASTESDPEGDENGELPLEQQPQWGLSIAAGIGIAQRATNIPMQGGQAVLATTPFPAVSAELVGHVRPDVASRVRLGLRARYTTSVGLLAEDRLPDGSTMTTDLRVQHLAVGVGTHIPLDSGAHPPFLQLELGWGFRILDAEVPISIPDYTLHGVFGRVGFWFQLGESPLALGIVPEVAHVTTLGDDLAKRALLRDGVLLGGEAHVRFELVREVAISLFYREAHCFLGTEDGAEMSDAERHVIVRGELRF